jgi:hypothetical protein
MDKEALEEQFGLMYHLILDRNDFSKGARLIKFVSAKDYPKFASVDNNPIIFGRDKMFYVATEYTIIYPKVFVRAYKPLHAKDVITRGYIH